MSDLADFDIFCYSDATAPDLLSDIDTHLTAVGGQVAVVGDTIALASGGGEPTSDLRLEVDKAVPAAWTLQFTCTLEDLPLNFGGLADNHVFFGASDSAGPCSGIFISAAGLSYTGAVSHDTSGTMRLDSALEPLAGSDAFVELGVPLTFRIAADKTTGAAYIYVTEAGAVGVIGHQLRYVVPAIDAATLLHTTIDRVLISMRGVDSPVAVSLEQLCLAGSLVIPNLPPRANAGNDQAVRSCSIARLDAGQSFDPEGAPLAYSWRLVGAPSGSTFAFEGHDGGTMPESPPSGFTNKFYSVEAAAANVADPFDPGDVLLVGGSVYSFSSAGGDIHGAFLQMELETLPDNLTAVPFKMLRQRGVANPNTQSPTFLPDAPGLYKFGLTVNDGALSSSESFTVVNVLDSPVPRGCLPDLGFIWNYLSDFWRLVDGKERIDVFFQSMAQVAASELLTLWQVDYSKSLRDIQRSVQRRWLHYDLLLPEPLPELTTVRQLWGGIASQPIAAGGQSGIAGTVLALTSPLWGSPVRAVVAGTNPMTAAQVASSLDIFLSTLGLGLRAYALPQVDGSGYVRIDGQSDFSVDTTSSLPIFTAGQRNIGLSGTGGVKVGIRTYKVPVSLASTVVASGDVLAVDGLGYRIASVVDDPSDSYRYQRVVVQEDLPQGTGSAWVIPGQVTSQLLDFWAGLVSIGDVVTFEVVDLATSTDAYFDAVAVAPVEMAPGRLGVDLTAVQVYLSDPDRFAVRLAKVTRRRYVPVADLVEDVPTLQANVAESDETQILHRNVDFYLDAVRGQSCLRFEVGDQDVFEGGTPPPRLWAETTYIDNRPTIQGNFGIQAGFTLENLQELGTNLDYLSAVRGLWYAYLKGPTLFNLRVGTQILLGLPFAEETGVIQEIQPNFSPSQGRLLLSDLTSPEVVRSYQYPAGLLMELNPATGVRYQVGDTVQQFAPIVEGAVVTDYIRNPQWFGGLLQQGVFLEVEKFHKFLVKVASEAFGLSALLFVQSFISRVKPSYTLPIFVVTEELTEARGTEVNVQDELTLAGTLSLYDGACFGNYGVSTHFDDPRAAGGGWHNQYDADANPNNPPPTYPTSQAVAWGFDKKYLCPEENLFFIGMTQHAGGAVDTSGMFASGSNVKAYYVFGGSALSSIAAGPAGTTLSGGGAAVISTDTISGLWIYILGLPGGSPTDYTVVVQKDSSDVATQNIDTAATGYWGHITLGSPISVTTANTLTVRIMPTTGGARTPAWASATVYLVGGDVTWSGSKPAGTYLQVSSGWPAPWY